jgi:hypothetical protein
VSLVQTAPTVPILARASFLTFLGPQ